MKIVDPSEIPAKPGEAAYFSGNVQLRRMVDTGAVSDVKILRVEFPAGARTNWHIHSGVQVLVVVEGRCRFQHWGGPVQEAGTGELIHIPADEKHWHGATPDAPMVHLAINIALETEWLEPVADA
jgi:quercetin dioxygenase-like cupin family protein